MKVEFYSSRGGCLTRLMLLSIAVMVGAWLLPGIEVESFWAVFWTAIVISLLNNLIRPVLIVITLPAPMLFHSFKYNQQLISRHILNNLKNSFE